MELFLYDPKNLLVKTKFFESANKEIIKPIVKNFNIDWRLLKFLANYKQIK